MMHFLCSLKSLVKYWILGKKGNALHGHLNHHPAGARGGTGKHKFSLVALATVKAGAVGDPSGMLAATSLITKWWRDQVLNVVPELKFA